MNPVEACGDTGKPLVSPIMARRGIWVPRRVREVCWCALRRPYVLLYEFSRYAGLSLGRRHESLPAFIKKRVSSHRLFD
jgi:hypothetical protein